MRVFYILAFFLLNGLLGQKITLLPTPFDMSVSQFRGTGQNTETVVNLMIPKTLFQWVDKGENYEFEGVVDVRVFIYGNSAAQDVFRILESAVDRPGPEERPVSYTHLTLPTNREV